MAGAGYDISASASNSSSAATGAIKFGAVNVVSNAATTGGLSWKVILLAVVLPGGLVALAVWYIWKKRKG